MVLGMRRIAFVLCLTGSLGCGSDPNGTWAARLDGTDAWLAVSIEGNDSAAFVCGGPETLETHTRWMLGSAAGGRPSFARDGWTLEFEAGESEGSGQLVDPDGATISFTAEVIDEDDPLAGLYFGFDSGCGDGLIVLNGSSSEVRGAWCDTMGNRAQVTPIAPVQRTDEGIAVTAMTAVGTRDFFMTLVDPATVTP
jgi:hypothetical protein